MSDWPTAGVDYTLFPNGRVEVSVVKPINTSKPVSLVDRLEAMKAWLLWLADLVDGSDQQIGIRQLAELHVATLDDAIEALHPVHGE